MAREASFRCDNDIFLGGKQCYFHVAMIGRGSFYFDLDVDVFKLHVSYVVAIPLYIRKLSTNILKNIFFRLH
jgi:hypothetical protein